MVNDEVDQLIGALARLPGLGPRSARRAVLHLLQRRETQMRPLAALIVTVADLISTCSTCGNLDTRDPCRICRDANRDHTMICVVEDVADVWALERAAVFRGDYHVLGGTLSALSGIGPEDLHVDTLCRRAAADHVREVILATNATADGQTTAHYVTERLSGCDVKISRLAHGVPIGGELDYMDEGTLATALAARRPV